MGFPIVGFSPNSPIRPRRSSIIAAHPHADTRISAFAHHSLEFWQTVLKQRSIWRSLVCSFPSEFLSRAPAIRAADPTRPVRHATEAEETSREEGNGRRLPDCAWLRRACAPRSSPSERGPAVGNRADQGVAQKLHQRCYRLGRDA